MKPAIYELNSTESLAYQRSNKNDAKLMEDGVGMAGLTTVSSKQFKAQIEEAQELTRYFRQQAFLESKDSYDSTSYFISMIKFCFPQSSSCIKGPKSFSNALRSRVMGIMLGSAAGDALGAPFEFLDRIQISKEQKPKNTGEIFLLPRDVNSISELDDPMHHKNYQVVKFPINSVQEKYNIIGAFCTTSRMTRSRMPGYWTDDFSQALCISEVLTSFFVMNDKKTDFTRELAIAIYDWWTYGYCVPYPINQSDKIDTIIIEHYKQKELPKMAELYAAYRESSINVTSKLIKRASKYAFMPYGLGGNTQRFIKDIENNLKTNKQYRKSAKESRYSIDPELSDRNINGNGSLMRNAPICVLGLKSIKKDGIIDIDILSDAMMMAMKQSFVTHGGYAAAQCCAIITYFSVRLAENSIKNEADFKIKYEQKFENLKQNGNTIIKDYYAFMQQKKQEFMDKDELWQDCLDVLQTVWREFINQKVQLDKKGEKDEEIEKSVVYLLKDGINTWRTNSLALFDWDRYVKNPGYIGSYVCDALFMSLNAFYRCNSPYNCLVDVCCRGGDSDSIGAITGSLVGSYYGIWHFPTNWIVSLSSFERIPGEIAAKSLILYDYYYN